MSQDDILDCVELLDLDEDVIDERLKSIMHRDTFTKKQLSNAVLLLKYKLLINNQENDDCDNDEELKFATKLLLHMEEGNVSLMSKILSLVLNLNKESLVSNSEHLLQQILSNLFSDTEASQETLKELFALKICDCILDVLITSGLKASLVFLEAPVDKILHNIDENLRKHFLLNTVPRLIVGTLGYSVLDKIFEIINCYKDEKIHDGLKMLSCLADFYLPQNGNALLPEEDFSRMVQYGMSAPDVNQRKTAIYLAKRAAEVNSKTKISSFFISDDKCKNIWDSYFVLIESLDEKQSNIVLPSLQLFEALQPKVSKLWLNFAFNIGLKHENTQVKKQCIEHRLKLSIESINEARDLLESMNDINLYSNQKEAETLVAKLKDALKDNDTILRFWQAVPKIQWSPIPLYYISSLLDPQFEDEFIIKNEDKIIHAVIDIIKLQCNNIAIKQHMQHQMVRAINKMSKHLNWRSFMKVLALANLKARKEDGYKKIVHLLPELTKLKMIKEEQEEFHNFITNSPLYIRETLNYFVNTEQMKTFLYIINGKINNIRDTNSRQYCNKMQCFDDYVYLMHLSMYLNPDPETIEGELNMTIITELVTFMQYLLSILTDDANITISSTEDINIAGNILTFSELINHHTLQQVYKTAMTILTDKDYNDLVRKVLCIKIIDILLTDPRSKELYKPDLDTLLNLKLTNENANREIQGKLKDYFYETMGSIAFSLLTDDKITEIKIENVIKFIELCMECGGSESVFWAVRIVALNLNKLNNKIDLKKFIEQIWREMEEMSTETYVQCMSEFTNIILHDVVITNAEFNNTVLVYFNKILELGKSQACYDPLYCFVCSLKEKRINMENGQLVHFLEEILMFAPVQKREQRILDGIACKIDEDLLIHGNVNQKYTALSVQEEVLSLLLQIKDDEVHQEIINFIMNRIDETFKNRDRYHADSQHHKTMLIGLQHLLFYALLRNKLMAKKNVDWCVKLLNKMPHQPSVKICLEWYIALYICSKKLSINEETVKNLNMTTLPQTSQLSILYHAMKHRINCDLYEMNEYEFVIKFLLSNTMGPNFNVRLLAQYLALKLHTQARPDPDYHRNIINIVEKTLQDSSHEKAYIKLEKDFFVDQFDVICHLTPYFIYRFVPKYFGLNVSSGFCILPSISECKEYMQSKDDDIKAWSNYCWTNDEVNGIKIEDIHEFIDTVKEEATGAIQKKYIPWKNMDVGYGDNLVKKETSSELIIVASLIDKLPNLGGLARTSEVFGVKTCIVPSLAKLRDPQFQGLSVSAERWVDIKEVRPGQPLKQYLMMKKDEGYTVVAAEQTSDSILLQRFKFPKKTVLVLGHEKNGVPCDLLPLMDACVEIPQSGFVRSLNVHVTAAIFVWEYSRQNMLQ